MKFFYLSAVFFLVSFFSFSQSYEVPHSPHAEDQLLQGPCYIFAVVAAMESKAMQAGSIAPDFNEWRYWSTCVLGTNYNDAVLNPVGVMDSVVSHMKDHGAVETLPQFKFGQAGALPNYSCGATFSGLADFSCETQNQQDLGSASNNDWCDKYGAYTGGGTCQDQVEVRTFRFTQRVSLSDRDVSFDDVEFGYSTSEKSSSDVITQLSNGNGVIAVIDNYRSASCGNQIPQPVQHAIFIYKHSNGLFTFKDSWPGAATSSGTMNVSQFDNHNVQSISYITGNAQCIRGCSSPDDESCGFSIFGPNEIGCSTASYKIAGASGSPSNISWTVPTGVTIVSGQNQPKLRVRSTNCGSTIIGTIQVSFSDINCNTLSKSINITGGNVSKPSGIQLNGPSSFSTFCPGSAAQLVAIDDNAIHCPIYEWSISGATISSGQGTKALNIVSSSNPNAFQSYSVRVRKECGSFTGWTTLNGNLGNCSIGGGGIGIFGRTGAKGVSKEDELFLENPAMESMKVEVLDLFGRVITEFNINRSRKEMDLGGMPNGILIMRYYDENNSLLDTKKIIISN